MITKADLLAIFIGFLSVGAFLYFVIHTLFTPSVGV